MFRRNPAREDAPPATAAPARMFGDPNKGRRPLVRVPEDDPDVSYETVGTRWEYRVKWNAPNGTSRKKVTADPVFAVEFYESVRDQPCLKLERRAASRWDPLSPDQLRSLAGRVRKARADRGQA